MAVKVCFFQEKYFIYIFAQSKCILLIELCDLRADERLWSVCRISECGVRSTNSVVQSRGAQTTCFTHRAEN